VLTKVKREVAAAAVVRMRVPIEFFLREYRDIAEFKKGPAVLEIGKFGDPPHPDDQGSLTWDSRDVQDLLRCKPGDCGVKMSTEMMRRTREQLQQDFGKGRNDSAERLLRSLLAEYAADYLAHGDTALISYDDQDPPVRSGDEFREVLQASPYLIECSPSLYNYFANFPHVSAPGVEAFLYWSKEKFGLKPVISITHAAVYTHTRNSANWGFIVSKQIYATHYFEASLGLTFLAPGNWEASGPESLVIYINRSRSDGLRGWLSGLKRSMVTRRVRSGMRKNLETVRQRLEAKYRAATASFSQ